MILFHNLILLLGGALSQTLKSVVTKKQEPVCPQRDLNVSQHSHKWSSAHGPNSKQRRVTTSRQPETKGCLEAGWPLFTFYRFSTLPFQQRARYTCSQVLRAGVFQTPSETVSKHCQWTALMFRFYLWISKKTLRSLRSCVSPVTHLQAAEGSVAIFSSVPY